MYRRPRASSIVSPVPAGLAAVSPAPGRPGAVPRRPRSRTARASDPGGSESCRISSRQLDRAVAGRPPGSPRPAWPSAPTRPSRMVTVRPSALPTSGSWVTTITVVPRSSVGRLDQVDDRPGGFVVELAGRLVGQQQPRPVGQRDRDGEPLLLAAGQPARGPPGGRGRARPRPAGPRPGAASTARERRVGPCANSTLPTAVSLCSRLRPGFCSTTPTSRSRMSAADRPVSVAEPAPAHLDQAGRGPQQAGQQPQQGGLAGARRAEQRDRVSLGHREIHPAQRGDLLARGRRRPGPGSRSAP